MTSIQNDIEFVGLGLRSEEVVSGGRLALISSFPVVLILAAVYPHPVNIVLTVILPLLLQRAVISYPATLVSRIERSSLREAPQVIGHLVGGAGGVLTHESAVLSSSRNSTGMLRGGFERMVWNLYTKGSSIPEDFAEYVRAWRGRNRGFEEALQRFSTAARLGRVDNVGSVISPVHTHTRRKLKGYLASLKTPVNVVFTLGIALPVMIASILPMSSLAVAAPVDIIGDPTDKGGSVSPIGFALVLDVIFPLGMFLYCREVLSRRPLSSSPRFVFKLRDSFGLLGASAVTIVIGVALLSGALPATVIGSVVAIAFASSVMAIAMLRLGGAKSRPPISREAVSEVLGNLGDFLLMGDSLEVALLKTAEGLEGSDLAAILLNDIFLISRGSNEGGATLTRENTIDTDLSLGTNLKVIVEAARKDECTAGSIAKRIAADLRDLSQMEADARDELKSVVQTVNGTITIFSPIVLGTTASMFLLMEVYFAVSGGLTTPAFIGILGTLLCCNLAVASYFTETLQGGDFATVTSRIGRGLLVAMPVFALSFMCASYLFGVL
jgi:hypothetical protein